MTLACFLATAVVLTVSASAADRPNIVLILADDIGYGDLSCYGATKVKTPHLDGLASKGMKFTDAHCSASVCTPTRYSVLTGQYAWRHPPGQNILSGVAPLAIPLDRTTIPKMLHRAGYATAVVGKWHLGLGEKTPDYNGDVKPGPREVGFDESFIIPATGDRTPCVYLHNGRVVNGDPADPIRVSYGRKIGDEPTGKEHPELLFNQKPSLGHDGTIVNGISRIGFMSGGAKARWKDEDMADELVRRANSFIDGSKDKPFFLYFATHGIHVPRCPHPRFRGKSECGLRGDAIVELDSCVGELLATLDRLHLTQKTLVLFTSDNGGVMDDGYADGSGGDSSGHRCNGALRGYKGGPYEGGTRIPMIARWPGKIPEATVSNELVSSVDFLATFAALTGQSLSADAGPDSFDVSSAFFSPKPARASRDHVVTQGRGISIRKGSWKLIPPNPAGREKKKSSELFDLSSDLSESKNLAAERPEKVAKLSALLQTIKNSGRSRPTPE